MSHIITYAECPSCKSNGIAPVLEAEDFTVSHEVFSIWECRECTLRFTQKVPDATEIGRYYQSTNYISHTDSRKGIINRLYHLVRNHTLRSKRKLITEFSAKHSGRLLDIGAGTGAFVDTMLKAGWQVTGLEPDATARQNALHNYGIDLQIPEILFTLEPETFEVITLWHVLEHVHELERYLQRFHSLLKKEGVLVVAVPNYTSFDAKFYGSYWAAYDVPRHLYHFSPDSMDRLMQQFGFQVKACRPMWYDSFYVSMLSEKYLNRNTPVIHALWRGLQSNWKAVSDTRRCSSVIYLIQKN